MKFMLMIVDNLKPSKPPTEKEIGAIVAEHRKFGEALNGAGKWVAGDRLKTEFTRVEAKNGKRVATDGPFAETKEVVGGYYMFEAASKEEAVEWAKRCPLFGGDADHLLLFPVWEM